MTIKRSGRYPWGASWIERRKLDIKAIIRELKDKF